MLRIALNGFGRIGRNFVRVLFSDPEAQKNIELVVINVGKSDPAMAAYSFTYDTLMGMFPGEVEYKDGALFINSKKIALCSALTPSECDWKKYTIDWVVDATGKFTSRSEAQKHIDAGAQKVLITAPAQGQDITIIPGVNQQEFNPAKHTIVSLGSCTTNALVPVIAVLRKECGIESAFVTTVHAYTNSQSLLDVDASAADPRRSRSAVLNIIPTTTGAVDVVDQIFPDLVGKIQGLSLRVPVANVSLLDAVIQLKKTVSIDEVHALFARAAEGNMKGILALSSQPLVSSDYVGNSYSVVIDTHLTKVCGAFLQVCGWYDNEWAYSVRLKDFLLAK